MNTTVFIGDAGRRWADKYTAAQCFQDGYEELANAVILLAVKDYRKVLRKLNRQPDSRRWRKELRRLDSFFRSEWFEFLTDANPEQILEGLKKEAAV